MNNSQIPIRQLLDDIAWPDSTFQKAQTGMPTEDWDALFLAVQTRLKNCADVAPGKSPERSAELPLAATQTIVKECVQALQALHQALQQSRAELW